MAERVEIVVTANDAASQILRGIGSQFGALGDSISALVNGDIVGLTSQIIDFGKESITAFTSGAQAAKQLSMVSGDSIENASRFIQVLDDYELSQQDALAATKAMTKEGLTPNLETLAKLSDEYRAIQDPQQKNEFIIKNLGRAGLQWAKVLDQGSEALLDQADAVSENLIYTEKMYEQSEKLRLQQDSLNDAIEGVKVTIGSELVPVLLEGADYFNNTTRAIEIMKDKGLNPTIEMLLSSDGYIAALAQADAETKAHRDAMLENADAATTMTGEHEKTEEEIKAEEEAIKELTRANEEYLNLVGDLANNLTDYEQKHQEIQNELNEGKITLDEAGVKWQQLAAEQEKATYKMILNMLQQRLAEDGLDAAETAFLLQQGVEWGIYSQTAVDKANAVIAQVDSMVASYNSIPALVETNLVTNVITNYLSQGVPSSVLQYIPGMQSGGSVKAGNLYRVNETRTEYFQPSMSGNIIPLGNGNSGNGGITVVYSPMISTADRSEVQNKLLPAIIEGVRKAKADKII